jgi:hypothetical protein
MSLNALGVSQLAIPANSSAVAGSAFSYASGSYAGLTPANFDVILGTTGLFVAGVSLVNLSPLNVTSVAQANACIVEAWLDLPAVPAAAGVTTIGAKYCGLVTFTAGAPPTAVLTLNAVDGTGALVPTFVGTCSFRVYIPRAGFF